MEAQDTSVGLEIKCIQPVEGNPLWVDHLVSLNISNFQVGRLVGGVSMVDESALAEMNRERERPFVLLPLKRVEIHKLVVEEGNKPG